MRCPHVARTRATGSAVAALLVGATLVLGGAGAPPAGAARVASCSTGANPADIDGDGVSDLVAGAPDATIGATPRAGLVQVRYGAASHPDQRVSQADLPGQSTSAGAEFGAVVRMGFVDSDHCADLVVSSPGATVAGVASAGSVHILFGSSAGLGRGRPGITIDARTPGLGPGPVAQERFGSSLALTDLLGPGADQQLAVGIPGRTVDAQSEAGAVGVVDLAPTGSVGRARTLSQSSPHVVGRSEAGDRFGSAVDFESDLATARDCPDATGGCEGLAIGVPGENSAAGALVEVYPAGSPSTSDAFSQNSPHAPGHSEAGDRFGAALDFNHDPVTGDEHLAVGVPGEGVGSVTGAGAVLLLDFDRGPTELTQATAGIAGTPHANDHFGSSVLVTSGPGGRQYLVVSAPDKDVAGHLDAGQVSLVRLDVPDPGRSDVLVDQGTHVPGRIQSGEHFGDSLGSNGSDLLLGVPDDVGWNHGMVALLPWATALRTSSTDATIWAGPLSGRARFGASSAGPAAAR